LFTLALPSTRKPKPSQSHSCGGREVEVVVDVEVFVVLEVELLVLLEVVVDSDVVVVSDVEVVVEIEVVDVDVLLVVDEVLVVSDVEVVEEELVEDELLVLEDVLVETDVDVVEEVVVYVVLVVEDVLVLVEDVLVLEDVLVVEDVDVVEEVLVVVDVVVVDDVVVLEDVDVLELVVVAGVIGRFRMLRSARHLDFGSGSVSAIPAQSPESLFTFQVVTVPMSTKLSESVSVQGMVITTVSLTFCWPFATSPQASLSRLRYGPTPLLKSGVPGGASDGPRKSCRQVPLSASPPSRATKSPTS
jgi:hypothetical protein